MGKTYGLERMGKALHKYPHFSRLLRIIGDKRCDTRFSESGHYNKNVKEKDPALNP